MINIKKSFLNYITDVRICWDPSHTGISGSDQADKAAKTTLNITTEKKV